ncbi:16S rRNA (cytidine1402-2'-O)-methyltransferase [Roseovarius azorensis]|uniref:Ribosomal RNA small subunit methyltransferase I n=1 Tax=Roseovarius azorensis TaxID=1287727 RepID=A0A1H7VVX4_9RHOB|nr:16S rRNA (cytidine(1402)-2'-O)-methyltransferase [Roseovarius azorensis]SEM13019.1 16S rRNA (cytidine1402-2'-O)-methyltransferase [Roseovarius azorensis]
MVNPDKQKLAAGLYLIATPIGTARDITLRALDILAAADVLVAEDTRSLRRLMEIHGVGLGERPLWSYHEHNGARMRPRIMAALGEGKSVVYASEAGTPMVADPGFDLGRAAVAEGFALVSAPGPSAVITALTLAGLPTDRFLFTGFLPNTSGRRKAVLAELATVPATLVFYESPNRVAAMLRDAVEVLGADRAAALCRELTKKFEEIRRGTLADLAAGCATTPPKGEIVVIIDRGSSLKIREVDLDGMVRVALKGQSVRDAADRVAAATGLPRRQVYQRALHLAAEERAAGPEGE